MVPAPMRRTNRPERRVANDHHVTPDGAGDCPTIAAAAAAAASGDVLQLAPGVFTSDGNRDVVLDRELTVRGHPGAPDACVID